MMHSPLQLVCKILRAARLVYTFATALNSIASASARSQHYETLAFRDTGLTVHQFTRGSLNNWFHRPVSLADTFEALSDCWLAAARPRGIVSHNLLAAASLPKNDGDLQICMKPREMVYYLLTRWRTCRTPYSGYWEHTCVLTIVSQSCECLCWPADCIGRLGDTSAVFWHLLPDCSVFVTLWQNLLFRSDMCITEWHTLLYFTVYRGHCKALLTLLVNLGLGPQPGHFPWRLWGTTRHHCHRLSVSPLAPLALAAWMLKNAENCRCATAHIMIICSWPNSDLLINKPLSSVLHFLVLKDCGQAFCDVQWGSPSASDPRAKNTGQRATKGTVLTSQSLSPWCDCRRLGSTWASWRWQGINVGNPLWRRALLQVMEPASPVRGVHGSAENITSLLVAVPCPNPRSRRDSHLEDMSELNADLCLCVRRKGPPESCTWKHQTGKR